MNKSFERTLNTLKRANLFRERTIFDDNVIDLSSNDYLGMSKNKLTLKQTYKDLKKLKYHSPKASILVNGYSKIHKEFENYLCKINNFEDAICVGSGFLANLSLFETLIRKGDILFCDEEYHASGILATRLLPTEVIFFKHNDYEDLENLIMSYENIENKNIFIAVEGIYSMSGNMLKKEFFDIANRYNSYLIVDEAHSSCVVGPNLLGIFDFYNIKPNHLHIKMGTLGKAYGSYGAYILANKTIINFLENRAKPIIYTTAPSLFDIRLAHNNLRYIITCKNGFIKKISQRQKIIKDILGIEKKGLVIPIEIGNNSKVLQIKENLLKKGFLVGAIRQPTVKKAIIRLIPNCDIKKSKLKKVCKLIKEYKDGE
jgi:8-amino-7-oxononanoate synthase